METVMSVGLRLCALEFTTQQLKTLAYLAVTGLLPESFPHALWARAIQRSFCSQEVALCENRTDWEDTRQILALVNTGFSYCGILYRHHFMDSG